MPPEPLPWDRKDFFRDRKHELGGGPVARWRDSSSSSSSSSRNWGFHSDFRRPPGHGKQGGWHMYPEDSAHGYLTPRSGDRFLDDNGFRPSVPRGDGRYGRFYRDNRGFGQREWRGHSWGNNHHDSLPTNGPGRQHFLNDQRSVGDSPMRASHTHSEPCDQFHSKDQADKTNDANGSGTCQKADKENSLGALDWKPLKWSRSGSLTSRGSGFSHSSSSKSVGGETSEAKGDLPPKNVSPIRSPSGDAVASAPSNGPSEETTSRKKPRLGWGEGLAKYEKKRVDGPEENAGKVDNATSLGNVEPTHSVTSNLIDKSPRVAGLSDCSSPATPSSVACSSSPGLDDKAYGKAADVNGDANNLSVSSMPVPETQLEESHFSLEKLELTSISDLSSLLVQLLQADEQCSTDSGFVKSSALNKLLLWKGDISKELELTETEVDSLEGELKSLKSISGSDSPYPASLSSLSTDCIGKSCEDVNTITRPPPLEMVSSGDMIVEEALPCDDARGAHTGNEVEDIESPGTATSKFGEPTAGKSVSIWKNSSKLAHLAESTKCVTQNLAIEIDVGKAVETSLHGDDKFTIQDDTVTTDIVNLHACVNNEENMHDAIFASNKESAQRAAEVLVKLLPSGDCLADTAEAIKSCLPADLTIKEKFLRRKRFLKFKERLVSVKYKALQHCWKEDLRLLALRSHRAKLQRKYDMCSRNMQNGNLKHRSSIRSRFASPAGSLSLIPTPETKSLTGKLLVDSQVKIYRSNLKMPSMILDEKEKMSSRFASNNGLVEDPWAVEDARALINPWTVEETEIFMDKLATFGKDFSKIASCLDHKTTADCVEFYYKNHKSECFEKTKKKPELKKQAKPLSSSYLLTTEKRWSREMNAAASLDILGAASVIAAQADEALEGPRKLLSGKSSNRKSRGSDGACEASSNYYVAEDERENTAADVLAGICGSLSSEAMSSCITSSIDPAEGSHDWKHQKVGSSSRRPLTPEVTQKVDDDAYSDESCGEMDPVDWTDDEKSLFVQAFSSHGKDFVMISRCVRTKSRDQCKVFFSKARKCLGLDGVQSEIPMEGINASNDANGGGSDAEDACVVETGSVVCSDKSGTRTDEDFPHTNHDVSKPEAIVTEVNTLEDNWVPGQSDHRDAVSGREEMLPVNLHPDISGSALGCGVFDVKSKSGAADDIPRGGPLPITGDDTSMAVALNGGGDGAIDPTVVNVAVDSEAVGFAQEMSVSRLENGVTEYSEYSSPFDLRGCMTNRCESSPEQKGFPLDLSIKAEMNDMAPCIVEPDIRSRSLQDFAIKKCSHEPSRNAVAELPLLPKTEVQSNDLAGTNRLSETEKPFGNGDVKLFGKILSTSTSADKPPPSAQDNGSKAKRHSTSVVKSDVKGTSTSGKLDSDSFLGLENVPIKSYGFWDGTKIQTGFSSLPESALLLSKYPAALANYPISSPKTEPQALQAAVGATECNVNGACVFSPREFRASNGSVVEFPVYRNQEGVQPFRLDMKQRQESLPEGPLNGFESMSGFQQQGKGLVTLNVVQGGDILVGGSCTGISDPVAALKLHYARTQQYGGAGNGVIREESWRGQGDLGR